MDDMGHILIDISRSKILISGCAIDYRDLKYLDKNECLKIGRYIDKINKRKAKQSDSI